MSGTGDVKNGPLTNQNQITAEREATSHLFANAYGLFKNPLGHNSAYNLTFDEAFHQITLSSLLLHILDAVEKPSPVVNSLANVGL